VKRSWIGVVAVVLVIAGGLFVREKNTARSKEATAIQTVKITRGGFVKTVDSSGKTKATKSVALMFQTSGKLSWVGVKEGDRVAAYQAIAGMDVREVQKNLEKSLRDYSAERSDFEESWRTNWRPAAESHESILHAPTDAVRIILEKNQWDLDKAVLDVELKHLSLEYATLVTPIAGIVTSIDTPVPGVNITPATSVFEIVDPDSVVFEVNVDEIDVGDLAVGQTAEIRLDAFPSATFSGSLTSISFASETSAGGATIFPVEVAFDTPQKLRIGLNGDISIESARTANVLVVPSEAIREDDTGKFVYRKTGTMYKRTPVSIGLQNDSQTVITSGLSAGDEIVIKGFTNIPKNTK